MIFIFMAVEYCCGQLTVLIIGGVRHLLLRVQIVYILSGPWSEKPQYLDPSVYARQLAAIADVAKQCSAAGNKAPSKAVFFQSTVTAV